MRRRERFVIIAILLGVFLYFIQLVPLVYRYQALIFFSLLTYFATALALKNDLKIKAWMTILPLPALYSLTTGLFYFLLPENFWSKIIILGFFALGLYGLFLTGNIFLVSHGRTIQLLQAAKNIVLFFSIIISLLGIQIIFSLNLSYYINFFLVLLLHLPLIYTTIWSVNLDEKITWAHFQLTFFSALIISEIALILSFLPLEPWHIALLIMSVFYLILGVLQAFVDEKIFANTINEYLLLAIFISLMFIIFFPAK